MGGRQGERRRHYWSGGCRGSGGQREGTCGEARGGGRGQEGRGRGGLSGVDLWGVVNLGLRSKWSWSWSACVGRDLFPGAVCLLCS